MPPERNRDVTTTTSSSAPYRLPEASARDQDLRVDEPPLFRQEEEAATESPNEPVDSAEDNGFRRDFNAAVYERVRSIPEGRVASYGQIARMIGHPRHSRMVGAALKALPARLSNPYLPQTPSSTAPSDNDSALPPPEPNPDFVPWHRVVASSGMISPRANPAATRRQAEWLEAEGVTVLPANGEAATLDGGRVRMTQFGWAG
ncbi:hypothetical protein BMF94_6542 [Rhodotorula taiwanensis]|uniref:Methylated-DNA-[protein]-cysteine S-methyltransferase DNA binding domain-containing protein n=1 Tax=Rhodotorula taiwanensis TaxID=741276 RepID=A0A2S5B106_9BASI|nr:hypothetical protein BMF94_6542 [Rhodotorula taiwanensis]